MLSISIGPLALPVAPLLLMLAAYASGALASRIARRQGAHAADAGADAGTTAGNAIFHAVLLGLLAARLAWLALHADAYLLSPWAAFDLRDGGWHAASGIAAGAAWLLWRAWRAPVLRRAIGLAAPAGIALWLGASWLIGQPAAPAMPALLFSPLEGQAPMGLAEVARGRPAVVNLWASWCGPCRQEMPMLAAAQRREPSVAFVFVNQGESAAAVRAYLIDQDLALQQVLLDPASALLPAVGSRGLPTTLFYDARGRLVEAHFGVLNAAALEARVQSLRPQR